MPLAVSILNVDRSDKSFLVRGRIVPSGTYPTGGDTLDFSGIGDLPVSQPPKMIFLSGQAGFVYSFVPGSTLANGKVKVFCNTAGASNAPLGEHTNATYAGGVSGDTIDFLAVFDKLL